ncbi:unnamed protein product [Dovyalis caffra]|uniref:Uncharacterized protein n=1 Tax=Dovyalis caffra TaxID=77055 RepID=A0AAV1QU60_9ROSI|nr:unnamed protein product [Dovyalis caffra]
MIEHDYVEEASEYMDDSPRYDVYNNGDLDLPYVIYIGRNRKISIMHHDMVEQSEMLDSFEINYVINEATIKGNDST